MPVYTVPHVTTYLKGLIEQDFLLQDIWVSGEIANLARPGSGHTYFTLREDNSSLRCVMFRNARGPEHLDSGVAVVAHGRLTIYEARGDLQLVVDLIQPEGVGELQLQLEQLKLKLENEGLFEASRKRAISAFPRKIGIVTSPTSAVWHDIQTVIKRRYPLVDLLLAPTSVQGESASLNIVDAFQALNQEPDVDVIIVARGGGSFEDLWPFNEEAVARAIFSSCAPVISAVGHETDFTISDMVADHRAPTPSAAAAMAVPDKIELATRLLAAKQFLVAGISTHIATRADTLRQQALLLDRNGPDLDKPRIRVDDLLRSAKVHLKHNLEVKAEQSGSLERRLQSLSPVDTLRRGYAIVQRKADNTVVSDSAQVKSGDSIKITLGQGDLDADIISARKGGSA